MVMRLAAVAGSTENQLAVEVTTSAKVIHRGDEFKLDINITNTLEKKVESISWSWVLPPGLNPGPIEEADKHITLTPGSSRTVSISISSGRPWWVGGSRKCPGIGSQLSHFNLMFSLEGGKDHTQSVPITLDILASPLEVYVGAIVGGIMGSMVNTLSLSWNTVVSGILGLFLVMISQRRTNVQLGVAVEDAVGGLVVGFLVGYLGTSYFKGFLPKT